MFVNFHLLNIALNICPLIADCLQRWVKIRAVLTVNAAQAQTIQGGPVPRAYSQFHFTWNARTPIAGKFMVGLGHRL